MINYAPHGPSDARIPSSLLDIYVQYKQDTRAAIAWLVSHGSRKHKSSPTLSIKDLLSLAEIVQRKAVEMPDIIDFHFRQAIAARTQLSQFFRKSSNQGTDDEGTFNHEYFTSTLKKIHCSLCACCSKPKDSCKKAHSSSLSESDEKTPPNRFTALPVSCLDYDSSSDDGPCGCPCHLDAIDEGKTSKSTPSRIDDDVLGEAFELHKQIQDMDDLLAATKKTWEQAGRGEVPLLVASFITNTAYTMFEEVEHRLRTICNVSDPEVLRNKFNQVRKDLGLPATEEDGSNSSAAQLVEALQRPWHLLRKMKDEWPIGEQKKTATTRNRPSQLVLRSGPNSASTDDECLSAILQNIRYLIQANHSRISIIRLGTPVYPEVGYFLSHDENDSNGLRCSFGLHLLLEAQKSYLFAQQDPCSPSTCRLQALKIAQEAIPSIRAVLDHPTMPCRCTGTLAYHLENLHRDFTAFLKTNVFDMFFQNPWVNGCHILEMNSALFYYGLRLFTYRNYMPSLAHTYNILRQFNQIPPTPLLEHLSTAFSSLLFPGGRPTRNFKTNYIRSLGGRLRFNNNNTHGNNTHHNSGCHLAIPSHIAKATAGFPSPEDPRLHTSKISLLQHIKQKGYRIDAATWQRINAINAINTTHGPPQRENTTKGRRHRPTTSSSLPPTSSPSTLLQSLQSALLHSSTSSFDLFSPTSSSTTTITATTTTTTTTTTTPTLDLLPLYLLATKSINAISDAHHGPEAKSGQHCLCFVDVIIGAADRARERGRGKLGGVEGLVGVLAGVLAGGRFHGE